VIGLARGEPSPAERARAGSAGATFGAGADLAGDAEHLIVDLPDPNEVAAPILRRATVFDDRGVLASPARVVVQPSLPRWAPAAGGAAGTILCGYAWAPLGRAVRAAIGRRPAAAGMPPRVLLCFGGSDPEDVTARLAPALAADPRWALEVIVGPDYRGIAGNAGGPALREPPDLVDRLRRADVAVVGAGTMKFEAAALGVPAIIVAVADDQLPVGPPFAATGAAAWAGDGRRLEPAALARALAALVEDPARREAMARGGPAVVPGDGAARILQAALGSGAHEEVTP